jgi:hypothetical protein
MNRLQYLLTKLAEEASEVAQIALKTQQFGVFEVCPGLGCTNLQRINFEYNDLISIAELINKELGDAHLHPDKGMRDVKKEKLEKYFQYSIECGQVNEP